ncbi:MAG: FKBP-type peptidyl-prolyl cis-trans isomerase [Chitinivibrionales bacterium]|nr:FKBP-type peptidyl-prolyl cis-trans isomerase [Chitinivibrionales bacterium]
MKVSILSVALLFLTLSCSSNTTPPVKKELKSSKEKFSYSIGRDMAKSILHLKDEVDVAAIALGLSDGMAEKPPLVSDEEAKAASNEISTKFMDKAKNKNVQEGEDFMKKNKAEADVKVTASGLQYKVLKEGTGAKPTASDKVRVHYKGTLIDGKEFDSSYRRGEPAEFILANVIKGWTEGLQLMSVGSQYRFVIPPQLAYGERGAGGDIGPNATLIFEVELLDIIK